MPHLVFIITSFFKAPHLFKAALLALFACNISFAQFDVPEIPKFQTSVYDYTNLLSEFQKNSLEEKLIKYSDTTSTQIVVAIIESTKGENINYLGAHWIDKWGIGQKGKDNGILVLLALTDKRIGINTGYGVEHLLTDALSKRIIERDIIPYFKVNDYYGGLNRGVESIFEVLKGEYQGTRQSNPSTEIPIGFIVVVIFILLLLLLSFFKNRKNGGKGGGGFNGHDRDGMSLLEALILSNAGRGSYRGSSGGFGGGGFGGGGFGGGFGGGSGGGGGASGGW